LLVALAKETNAPFDELVVRYVIIDELLGGQAFRAAVHAADYRIPSEHQYTALMAFEEVHRKLLRWWSWNESTWKLSPDDVEKLKPKFEGATTALIAALDQPAKVAYEARIAEHVQRGFSADVATTLARAPMAREAFALLAAVRDTKGNLDTAAPAYHRVGKDLHVDTFEEILAAQVPTNVWERRFHATLEREAANVRHRALGRMSEKDFVEKHREQLDRISDGLTMVRQLGGHGLIPLSLILEEYRALT
jgi:NAD-specific glutamate dehydrogenase